MWGKAVNLPRTTARVVQHPWKRDLFVTLSTRAHMDSQKQEFTRWHTELVRIFLGRSTVSLYYTKPLMWHSCFQWQCKQTSTAFLMTATPSNFCLITTRKLRAKGNTQIGVSVRFHESQRLENHILLHIRGMALWCYERRKARTGGSKSLAHWVELNGGVPC